MSTHMYLRCTTHQPYIESDQVGNYTSALPEIRKAIANRATIVENMTALEDAVYDLHSNDQYKNALWWFLFKHPHCILEIRDEYGREYSLEDDEYTPIEKKADLQEAFDASLTQKCVICGALPGSFCGPEKNIHLKRIWPDWK